MERLGGIIDGCPPGISIDFDAIQMEMSLENQDSPRSLPSAKNR
jgi:chorismate synthase